MAKKETKKKIGIRDIKDKNFVLDTITEHWRRDFGQDKYGAYYNDRFNQAQTNIEKKYARKKKKGKYDPNLVEKDIRSQLVNPIVTKLQKDCREYHKDKEPQLLRPMIAPPETKLPSDIFCNIPEEVKQEATKILRKEIEENQIPYFLENPEEMKVKRSKRK